MTRTGEREFRSVSGGVQDNLRVGIDAKAEIIILGTGEKTYEKVKSWFDRVKRRSLD